MADIVVKENNVLYTIDKSILQFNVSWLELQRAILLETLRFSTCLSGVKSPDTFRWRVRELSTLGACAMVARIGMLSKGYDRLGSIHWKIVRDNIISDHFMEQPAKPNFSHCTHLAAASMRTGLRPSTSWHVGGGKWSPSGRRLDPHRRAA